MTSTSPAPPTDRCTCGACTTAGSARLAPASAAQVARADKQGHCIYSGTACALGGTGDGYATEPAPGLRPRQTAGQARATRRPVPCSAARAGTPGWARCRSCCLRLRPRPGAGSACSGGGRGRRAPCTVPARRNRCCMLPRRCSQSLRGADRTLKSVLSGSSAAWQTLPASRTATTAACRCSMLHAARTNCTLSQGVNTCISLPACHKTTQCKSRFALSALNGTYHLSGPQDHRTSASHDR